jgi:hypothetical protein
MGRKFESLRFILLMALPLLLFNCGNEENRTAGKSSAWSISQRNKSRIKLEKSYYSSLCWYGFKQLGLVDAPVNPEYQTWADQLAPLLADMQSTSPLLGGPLYKLIYQIPACLNPNDPEELQKVFAVTKDFIRSGSPQDFMDNWPKLTHYWDTWYYPGCVDRLKESIAGHEETIFQVMGVWAEFMKLLWPQYLQIYEEKINQYPLEEYQERCDQLAVFKDWNEQFKTTYPYDEFHVIICSESPTMAGRLGPEKLVVGAKYSWDILINAITHEIGVRYPALNRLAEAPNTSDLIKNDYSGVVKLIEAEICVRKLAMLPDLKNDGYVTSMGLQNLVNWRVKIELDSTFEASLPALYAQAKEAGVL